MWGLADGMGGLSHGKLASELALETIFDEFYGGANPIPKSLGKGIESANARLLSKAQGLGAVRMGTTVTAAILRGPAAYRSCRGQPGLLAAGRPHPMPDERPYAWWVTWCG